MSWLYLGDPTDVNLSTVEGFVCWKCRAAVYLRDDGLEPDTDQEARRLYAPGHRTPKTPEY